MLTPIHHLCWLCGEALDLRTCKVDEYGEPVHEACYTARLALESGTRDCFRLASISARLEDECNSDITTTTRGSTRIGPWTDYTRERLPGH